jgi:Sulfotransferase domain
MLIITASMPRSGSGWYTHLHQDLLCAGGHPETYSQSLKEQLGAWTPRRIDRLETHKILMLAAKLPKDNISIIKTHQSPTYGTKYLLKKKYAKATFIYRDPRDVIVSALELGKKLREKGEAKRFFAIGPYQSFARFYTVDHAIRWVNWQLLPRWRKWTSNPNVLVTKYEDLVSNKVGELSRLATFLELDLNPEDLVTILQKYEPQELDHGKQAQWKPGRGPLLNKGIMGRYMTWLTAEEQEKCNTHLEECLKEMGY